MNLRILPIGPQGLWVTMVVASVIVASPYAARAFSDADLTGGFGCIGRWHGTGGKSGDITDLMQLNFDGKGGVTGSVHFLTSGEDCLASLGPGSGYSVDGDGLGSLTLNLSFSGRDADSDFNCAKLNPSKFSSQKIDFVLERVAHVFDMAAQDDLFIAPSDRGDTLYTLTGSCMGQVSF